MSTSSAGPPATLYGELPLADLPLALPADAREAFNVSHLAQFLAVSAIVIVTPGPDTALTIRNTLLGDRRAGVFTALGVVTGQATWALATAAGIAALLAASEPAFTAVKLAGAAYLGWLAIKALRGTAVFAPTALDPDSPRRLFTMGLLTNLLNPKIAVMYLSLIPQFIRPEDGYVLLQGFALGGVQIAVAFTGNLLIVLTAGTLAVFLSHRPVWMRVQRFLMGTVLGALAVKLAADRTRPITA
jgi:threonine/homoserine/homoserine lactone efflux protein